MCSIEHIIAHGLQDKQSELLAVFLTQVLQTLQSMKLTGSDVLKMIATAISNTLFWCQTFMRERKVSRLHII